MQDVSARAIEYVERFKIEAALQSSKWNKTRAAEQLGSLLQDAAQQDSRVGSRGVNPAKSLVNQGPSNFVRPALAQSPLGPRLARMQRHDSSGPTFEGYPAVSRFLH